MNRFALSLTLLLGACASQTPIRSNPPLAPVVSLGVVVDGGYAGFKAAEKATGAALSIQPYYMSLDFQNPLTDAANDIAHGITPMLSISAKLSTGGCVLLTDIPLHKADAALAADAAKLAALDGTTVLRPFYEGASTQADKCEQFTPQAYVAAFQYIHNFFFAHGVTAKYMWNPGEAALNNGTAMQSFPGYAFTDFASADPYDKGTQTQFQSGMCTLGPTLNIPWGFSETGATAAYQVAWLSTVCRGASFLIYWDKPGKAADYTLAPAAYPAFKADGQ